ncbi:AAA family ATPase [Aminithiophilus ramosus]|uniref:AAA family ATPase n=1 Tax=Aminithiophilus ramosus TaxID=3029084 RepID=A0A9Q7ABA0_9BACT|nr:ATP-binding protein [Aminithiophilus ramosus]QTX31908.1 AAA family ATPase [Aminithiophilus ramosus]
MKLTKLYCERFTAFDELSLNLSPGINVFVGANGTGKTHLMKLAYAACDITKSKISFAEKLNRVFLPSDRAIGRLLKRQPYSASAFCEVYRQDLKICLAFSNHTRKPESAQVTGEAEWMAVPVESVYIPVKEMLSNGPGFRSLYSQREIHFEEIYADILDRAYRPSLRGPADRARKALLAKLGKVIDGKVVTANEEFFLKNVQGNLEFTLLAEGIRKLGLLWTLIQNGTLMEGSVLFWDEPEANLNPSLYGVLMQIILDLQQLGTQVFMATHSYAILKELDLRKTETSEVLYHSLYRDPDSGGMIRCRNADRYLAIHPNSIAQAYADIYDREVQRTLGGSEL